MNRSGRWGQVGAASVLAALTMGYGTQAWSQRIVGARPAAESEEGGLWSEMDKAEQRAKSSGERDNDPALNAYVGGVVCRVAGTYCPDVRLYLMDRPFMNATMAPNGYTEVWSGLLLRAANEAELAFVLSHETTHFVQNHTLIAKRADHTRREVGLAIQVGIAVVGAAAASSAASYSTANSIIDSTRDLINIVYLGEVAAYFNFSREQESEADLKGMQRMATAGYDPHAAITIWQSQMAEIANSSFDRVRKAGARASILDDHPLDADRMAALEKALPAATGGDLGRDRYRTAIRPYLSAWLKDELRRRDYGETLKVIEHLAEGGEDQGVLKFYEGECYRLRRGDGDLPRAQAAYREASAYPDAPAAAWRELGGVALKANDKIAAKAALETYLARAPQADDAWLVRDDLKGL